MRNRLGRFVAGRLLPRIAYPVVRGPLKGAKFVLGSAAGGGGGASIYFNLTEPATANALVKELRPGNLFFDIGANIGYFTTLGSRLVGPRGGVIAFEPMARNLLYLSKHVAMNNLGNVSIVAAACSDSHQIATFAAGPNCAQGQLRDEEEGWVPGGGVSLAPTVTVDAVSALIKRYPDVIKIDVEGAELLVLNGARKTLQEGKPKVLLEVHSDSLKTECRDFLEGLGYVWETLDVEAERPLEMLFKPS